MQKNSKWKKRSRTIGYITVFTSDQDTKKNKADILMMADEKRLGLVRFVEEKAIGKKSWKERKIAEIIDDLGENDRLIVPELSRLGRSMLELKEILSIARQKGISIYAVKDDLELDGTIQSEPMAMAFDMAAEIERDRISIRTKAALKARKSAGVKLGRPRGPGKSKLDPHRDEIVALLKNGSTKAYVAKKYATTRPNLYNWLKKNRLVEPVPRPSGRKPRKT